MIVFLDNIGVNLFCKGIGWESVWQFLSMAIFLRYMQDVAIRMFMLWVLQ